MINIHNVKLSDFGSIEKIMNTKELGGMSLNYFKRLIKEGIFLVAEQNSKIIGIVYGEFWKKEDWAELTGVGVLKEFRNQGIGTQLIKEFEKIVYSKNIHNIELFAHIDTLAKYINKLGYKKKETYVNYTKRLKKS